MLRFAMAQKLAGSKPSTRHPELSVVVVTYNSADTIAACLESIEDGGIEADIVVVDNASADGTPALIEDRFARARVIRNATNQGFARANNLGWTLTTTPFVLLVNPDTILQPGASRALVDFARRNPRVGLVGPRLLNPNGSLQHSCFRFPNLRMVMTGFFGLLPLDSPANGRYRPDEYEWPHQVEHLLGACLLARREAAEAVGLFDEDFYMYFEETDWCYRMQKAGWENWYTPSATVVHRGAHSTAREPERMSAEFYRSQARFYRKHYRPAAYAALKALSFLGVAYWTARTAFGLIRGRVSAITVWRRLVSYWVIVWA
jgi:N-acetylglucosaminyl-diphospho-decaprenol L-rhamnosyltransferase